MGVFGDGDNAKKGKKRGALDVGRSLAGLGQEKTETGSADWRTANWTWASGIVIEVTRRGGLVSFGLSRDKGAYSVTVMLDGERRVVWIGTGLDLDEELEKIVHFVAALPE